MPRQNKEREAFSPEGVRLPSLEEQHELRVNEDEAQQLAVEGLLSEHVEPQGEEQKPMGRSAFELLAHAGPMYETLFEEGFLSQSTEAQKDTFLEEESQKLGKSTDDLTDKERQTILARLPEQPFSADALNAYLERQAHERWSKSTQELSEEQFGALLDDRETFKDWAADQVVELFLRRRKQELADWRKENTYQGGVFAQAAIAHPRHEQMKKKEQEIHWGRQRGREQQELMDELRRVTEEAETKITEDPVMQALGDTIIRLRAQQKEGRVAAKDVEALRKQREEKKAELRQTLGLEKQQQDLGRRIEEAKERRKTEFEDLDRLMKQEVEGGLKREMALASQRWGHVLKRLVKDGRVTLEAGRTGVTDIMGDPRKYVSDFLDVEVDRVVEAEREDKKVDQVVETEREKEAKARRKESLLNLEAIVRTEDEQKVVLEYADGIVSRLEQAYRSGKQGTLETEQLQKRYLVIADFLQNREKDLTGTLSFNQKMVYLEDRFRRLGNDPNRFERVMKGHYSASDLFCFRLRRDRTLGIEFLKGVWWGGMGSEVFVDRLIQVFSHSAKAGEFMRDLREIIKRTPDDNLALRTRMESGLSKAMHRWLGQDKVLTEDQQERMRLYFYKTAADLRLPSPVNLLWMKRDFRRYPSEELVTLFRREVPQEQWRGLAKELGREVMRAAGSFEDPEEGLNYSKSAMELARKIKAPQERQAVAAK